MTCNKHIHTKSLRIKILMMRKTYNDVEENIIRPMLRQLAPELYSYNGTSREWNIADIKEYIKGIESGERNYEIEHLTEEERYNDAILTRLRTAKGLPLAWIKERFSEKLYNYMLRSAEKEIVLGNLKKENGSLSLTEKGIFISDAVIRELIFI